jgi:hypothetical protein
MAEGSDCCFFVLTIPKGSHVLYIPTEYHAYPFENEILLPHGCTFNLTQHAIDPQFQYITMESVQVIQSKSQFTVGPVYELDPSHVPTVKSKAMNLFKGSYVAPR